MTMAAALFLVLSCLMGVESSNLLPHPDKITQLPGQPPVEFQHFSGYVTVDEKKEKALFYYFVEAEIDPLSKPLVLWLNGGPGCSSIGVGAFSENGPFRPNGQVLLRNEYSWNREANMLYLDTPIGVGFSYSTGASSYVTVNDEMTAKDNLVFLQRWFLKFPQYRNSSLFITGESYAGHYVPQLAKLIIELNKKSKIINLKGIALGNPLLEFTTDYNSRAEYFWVMSLVNRESSRFVNKYDVTLDVCIPSVLSQSKIIAPQRNSERIDVCVEDETVSYLNRRDVQKALHARLVGVRRWDVCSNILDYDMLDLEIPTISIIGSLIKEEIPVLIYSGDQDSVIPLTGSRTLVHRLAKQLGLNTTVPYRVWFEGQQVGGWTQVYGNLLSFATIRGASHEAPFSQPERSFVLFKSFLDGRPLPQEF
ncbi:UNVERIFIED_CONTAM: Serine carboxypeptidase-like 45 [Sesamum angustifolium]|uniref:Carboxypeptidase n=1 Tax=Sesamum angustifolium TaxID=2727405 RepID=A0AAW2LJV7_9LAMI